MKRIIASILAAGALASLVGVGAAHAEEVRTFPGQRVTERQDVRRNDGNRRIVETVRIRKVDYRERDRRQHDLDLRRRDFYAHWHGNRARKIAFERWYANQCDQLRIRY
jgi:hypothetical protein